METGTGNTKTSHFELDIIGAEDGARCYLCHTAFGQMFVVRPPGSTRGRFACIAHVGDVADGWDRAE